VPLELIQNETAALIQYANDLFAARTRPAPKRGPMRSRRVISIRTGSRPLIRDTGACNGRRGTSRQIRSTAQRIDGSAQRAAQHLTHHAPGRVWLGVVAYAAWSRKYAITGRIGAMFGALLQRARASFVATPHGS
jgi:hypothetical protein